ncbi:RagB/SusD family nutrient uptake outer membrane protein [Sphingobacterium sp.]|uniref:RagB/SusD family nutrient uptake outer membrane protein n=1 Tax=Sphingobacterium sp. TaxID=341027 RepID=UPI0031D49E21
MKNRSLIPYFVTLSLLLTGCSKYLDEKPDSNLAYPESATDLFALMNDVMTINGGFTGLIEMGDDDYILPEETYNEQSTFYQDIYTWQPKQQYEVADISLQWLSAYKPITYANIIEESLVRIKNIKDSDRKILKGDACFIKGFAYSTLCQVFSEPYVAGQENNGLGVVWRDSSDPNSVSKRLTVKESYSKTIALLQEAVDLLPEHVKDLTKPSKAAALCLLSRIYLYMQDYEHALQYADLALAIDDKLIKYSEIDGSKPFPFAVFNQETIYLAYVPNAITTIQYYADVPPEVYNLYQDDDLRKQLFFFEKTPGHIGFRGNYAGMEVGSFIGPTVGELYLIKAECLIRMGNRSTGLEVIGHLLENRWKSDESGVSTFRLPDFSNNDAALRFVLEERRKELIFRGARWSDLRRLNLDPNYAITLKRQFKINGDLSVFTLPPGDKRYTYCLPEEVIRRSGVPQTLR